MHLNIHRSIFKSLLIIVLSGTAHAALPVTYSVDLSDSNEHITGSITTNGVIGPLAIGDILSWAFEANGLTGFFSATSADASATVACPTGICGLSDTNTGLALDTTANTEIDFVGHSGEFVFSSPQDGSGDYFVTVDFVGAVLPYSFALPASTPVATVPEPSEASLMLIGLGLTGLVFVRRRISKKTDRTRGEKTT